MSKFVTGEELTFAFNQIVKSARKELILVSPYIQLDDYFHKEVLNKHLENHSLRILLFFGKNEKDPSKSLSQSDLNYFKQFHNITIIFAPNLHAKYYGNEHSGLLTSLNLHAYSFRNNIEYGVYGKYSLMASLFGNTWNHAARSFSKKLLSPKNEIIFAKRPIYTKSFRISYFRTFNGSDVKRDKTAEVYQHSPKWTVINDIKTDEFGSRHITDFENIELQQSPIEVITGDEEASAFHLLSFNDSSHSSNHKGNCIRCAIQIPFNPDIPYCTHCDNEWQAKNRSNRWQIETHCHGCGKLKGKAKREISHRFPECLVCYHKRVNTANSK